MIYTSNYEKCKNIIFKTCSISGDSGKKAKYTGSCYTKLAPKRSFWNEWEQNKNIITEEENNKFYIECYWKEVLSKLDPISVYNELDYNILICYEDNLEFCHRHIVSAWLELFLNIEIDEVTPNGTILEKNNKPQYIKEYLEKIIKNNTDMRGFNCLRALYLFQRSEMLEQSANKLEILTSKGYDSYRQAACYLRCDADEAEAEYNEKKALQLKK